ncbi:MAG: hypothetical protein IJT23_06550, partial [Clostridia bacterium]|nr:hypothetical protein [Clostridia bacterium]
GITTAKKNPITFISNRICGGNKRETGRLFINSRKEGINEKTQQPKGKLSSAVTAKKSVNRKV